MRDVPTELRAAVRAPNHLDTHVSDMQCTHDCEQVSFMHAPKKKHTHMQILLWLIIFALWIVIVVCVCVCVGVCVCVCVFVVCVGVHVC